MKNLWDHKSTKKDPIDITVENKKYMRTQKYKKVPQ